MLRRLYGFPALVVLLIGLVIAGSAVPAALAQDSTPVATPDAEETTEESASDDQEIVTIVVGYQPDEENDVLVIVPVQINPAGVATVNAVDDTALTGTVDFEAERNSGGLPRIVLGDSIFDAYPIVEGDRNSVQQWLYFQGNDTGRPATLVMQITADAGPYEGAVGTATFISRSDDSTGIIVIVLYLS